MPHAGSTTRVTRNPTPIERIAIAVRPPSITKAKTTAGWSVPSKRANRSAGPLRRAERTGTRSGSFDLRPLMRTEAGDVSRLVFIIGAPGTCPFLNSPIVSVRQRRTR